MRERCPKAPYREPTQLPPGVTSLAGTARSLLVNPSAEGSPLRAPCARGPRAPYESAQAGPPWNGFGSPSPRRGPVVGQHGLGFLNNHKAFEIDCEMNETLERRETWRNQRQARDQLTVGLKPGGQGEQEREGALASARRAARGSPR